MKYEIRYLPNDVALITEIVDGERHPEKQVTHKEADEYSAKYVKA
jgi:hypothetical protein